MEYILQQFVWIIMVLNSELRLQKDEKNLILWSEMGKNWEALVAFPQPHFLGVSLP